MEVKIILFVLQIGVPVGSKNLFSKEFRGGSIKGNATEIILLSSFMMDIMTFSSKKKNSI